MNHMYILGLLFLTIFEHSNAFVVSPNKGPRINSFLVSTARSVKICPKGTEFTVISCPNMVLHSTSSKSEASKDEDDQPLRGKLRQLTGFSLTAFRSTWRAATGISLTAVYASALAASGLWIRKTMSTILSIMPAWFRYFLQPFLVLYYAPLFILRGLTGPTRKAAQAKHDLVVEGWKQAVERAESKTQNVSWPAHVNDNGEFELNEAKSESDNTRDSQRLADAVADSVEQASEQSYDQKKP